MSELCGNCRYFVTSDGSIVCSLHRLRTSYGGWCRNHEYEREKRVFDHITESPEVLAEMFLFSKGERYWRRRRCETVCYEVWWSALTGEEYKSKAEALAATVLKLNSLKR